MKKPENKPSKLTQYDRIYAYVKLHGCITPMQAYELGITKLATFGIAGRKTRAMSKAK